ncbi:MAG: hypothetical protein ACPGJS_06290 [Flammeovirgaceae bacterium]
MDILDEKFEQKQDSQEKNSRRTGIIITVVFHGIVLLFFLVTMAWVPPDPPLPKYGIEVNFGLEGTEGSGNIQNKTKPNVSESLEKAKPNPKPTDKVENTKPDPIPEPVKEEVEPVKTDPVEDLTPVTDEAEEAVEVPKKEEEKPKKEKPKEEAKPKGSDADNTGKADSDITNNQGNKKDEIGDAGKKEGNVNADALIGGGSGGGASLNLDGWKWGEPPAVNDGSTETGKVTIKFKIDDEGTVISASIGSGRTVSAAVAEVYRQYVENKMYFTPKDNTGRVANFTYGSITFILTSK